MKIGFIGAGNMGGAILRGYAPFANEDGNEIFVYTPTVEKREAIARETGATATDGIEDIVRATDIIILGVKPNIFGQLMPQIAAAFAVCFCMRVNSSGVSRPGFSRMRSETPTLPISWSGALLYRMLMYSQVSCSV